MNFTQKTMTILALATLPMLAGAAGEHGAKPQGQAAAAGHDMAGMHKAMHGSMAGMAGDPAKVSRTIPVEMNDNMRFTPESVTVKAGETVRFFVVNKGKLPHEMVIGTGAELDEHAEMMRKMPGMKHAEPNQINLAAGQRGGIVWTFDKAGTFAFACLVPGHKEAGMVGKLVVN